MFKPKDIKSYILGLPEDRQKIAKEMYFAIRRAAPKAFEKISYGMPYFGYKGRLAYFALAKNHIGLYVPPPVVEMYKKELAKYVTAKATVQFPLDKKLPVKLVEKLVKARVKINDEQELKKKKM